MEIINHQLSKLRWKQGKIKRTVILSKNNNVATFWLAPGFREFEAYEATADFNESSNSQPFIADQVHIIEESETSYCKSSNPWKSKPQQAHPRGVDMNLAKYKPSKQWKIHMVEPTDNEDGMSDEALPLRYHRQF